MFEFIDEINNFIYKLSELIKDDWNKTKHFIKTYQTHILWLIILISFIEYVGIMNLSSIVGQPYKNNNKQHGGAQFTPNYTLDKSVKNMTTNYNKKTNNIAQNIARESADTQEGKIKQNNVSLDKDIPSPPADIPSTAATPDTKATDTKATDTASPATETSKATAKSKENGLFDKFAGLLKTGSSGKSASTKGKNNKERNKLGPVFGNLNMIMDYLKKIGSVLSVILVCLGVISLPVLIFLTIVYTVIKYLIKKVLVL